LEGSKFAITHEEEFTIEWDESTLHQDHYLWELHHSLSDLKSKTY
jgi:hypothetical protein